MVEVDGEGDEGAVAVHLRFHRGLHPAHGHGGGGRRIGRRQEDGVGLCGFKDLPDDRSLWVTFNGDTLDYQLSPFPNVLHSEWYSITFSWTLHNRSHGERLVASRNNKETL